MTDISLSREDYRFPVCQTV